MTAEERGLCEFRSVKTVGDLSRFLGHLVWFTSFEPDGKMILPGHREAFGFVSDFEVIQQHVDKEDEHGRQMFSVPYPDGRGSSRTRFKLFDSNLGKRNIFMRLATDAEALRIKKSLAQNIEARDFDFCWPEVFNMACVDKDIDGRIDP